MPLQEHTQLTGATIGGSVAEVIALYGEKRFANRAATTRKTIAEPPVLRQDAMSNWLRIRVQRKRRWAVQIGPMRVSWTWQPAGS
jgi:hypothetical protein